MPGFIDAHRHINTGPNEKAQMQALLEAGYTTILSGGGPADGNITLRDHIDKGVINGPRIIPSGGSRCGTTRPRWRAPRSAQLAAMGVKFTGEIALTPVPGPTDKEIEVLKAVVDEGKKAGVMVQVHAVSSIGDGGRRSTPACSCWFTCPNKNWVSKEDAKKLADVGHEDSDDQPDSARRSSASSRTTTSRGSATASRGPKGSSTACGSAKRPATCLVNARTVWDQGAIARLLHRHDL